MDVAHENPGSVFTGGGDPITVAEILALSTGIGSGVGASIAIETAGGVGGLAAATVIPILGAAGAGISAAGAVGYGVGTLLYANSESVQKIAAYMADGIAKTPEMIDAFVQKIESVTAVIHDWDFLQHITPELTDAQINGSGNWFVALDNGYDLAMLNVNPIEIIGTMSVVYDPYLGQTWP